MKPALTLQLQSREPSPVIARAGSSPTPEKADAPRRTSSPNWRIVQFLSQVYVAGPALLFAIVVTGWTAFQRLPAASRPVIRPVPPKATQKAGLPNFTAAELSELAQTAEARQLRLMDGREDLRQMLTLLEAQAAKMGWRIDWSPKAPVVPYAGFKQITALPVTAQLESADKQHPASYSQLMDWLRLVQSQSKCAEVTRLNLESEPGAHNIWQVELQFLCRTAKP